MCSTPEGIGTTITMQWPQLIRHRSRAQRPKASARRSPWVHSLRREETLDVLNARRHRHDDHALGDLPPAFFLDVLNARRHRHDDHASTLRSSNSVSMCSTPEGIGTTITFPSVRGGDGSQMCSTPEGIGTTITAAGAPRRRNRGEVLNARRHRHDDHLRRVDHAPQQQDVLNARRHRHDDHRPAREARGPRSCVLNARRHRHDDHHMTQVNDQIGTAVLNARRHRHDDHNARSRSSPVGEAACSTPEGIGTTITLFDLLDLRSDELRAQRPKASARRSRVAARSTPPA